MLPPQTGHHRSFAELNAPAFLERLRSDRPRAFARLVKLTHDPLFAFARRYFRAPEECQEIVQETYLAVHRSLDAFQGNSRLTTWMYSVAYHKICDQIAAKSRRTEDAVETFDGLEAGPVADSWSRATAWELSAERVLQKKTAEAWIAEAIRLLMPPGSEVYRLRDVEELSGEEVAALLGLTPENVRVLLHRARKQIVEWVRNKMAAGETQEGRGA
jgi:RNA polymerase sigma-70 factor (ECF subfamily)